jgi:hypothetical protein
MHPDWCDKSDDPVAVTLWKSDRPAMVEIWCGLYRHRIAKVYSLADGPKLCVRGFRIRDRQLYGDDADVPSDSEAHFHTALHELTDVRDRIILGRCACGTYSIERSAVRRAVIESQRSGETHPVFASWTDKPNTVQE